MDVIFFQNIYGGYLNENQFFNLDYYTAVIMLDSFNFNNGPGKTRK
jgi:hypothetical protein